MQCFTVALHKRVLSAFVHAGLLLFGEGGDFVPQFVGEQYIPFR